MILLNSQEPLYCFRNIFDVTLLDSCSLTSDTKNNFYNVVKLIFLLKAFSLARGKGLHRRAVVCGPIKNQIKIKVLFEMNSLVDPITPDIC